VSGGIASHPVDGKPQMFRKRTVSNVTSKVLESGGLPDGGKSKSHWELLITRNFNLKRDFRLALRTADKLAGG
jgi:hypothetical protein